jgi:hypothetical protein
MTSLAARMSAIRALTAADFAPCACAEISLPSGHAVWSEGKTHTVDHCETEEERAVRILTEHQLEWMNWQVRWGCTCEQWTATNIANADTAADAHRKHLAAALVEAQS